MDTAVIGAFDAFADRVEREFGDRPAVALAGVATELAAVLTGDRRRVATSRLARVAPRLLADASIPSGDIARLTPPAELASPDLLGRLHERLVAVDGNARRARGAVYTPRSVASGLIAEALHGASFAQRTSGFTVCDPSVGGGAFLLAAARVLRGNGQQADRIVRDLLWGIDVDPLAIAVAEAALALWALAEGSSASPGSHLVVGDAITDDTGVCAGIGPGGFDLVAGNPPFQNQLERATARSQSRAAQLRQRMGAVAAGYADTAVVFLSVACDLARIGGRVVLVQPLSMLGTRDAARTRDAIAARTSLVALWVAPSSAFGADVHTCAPVLEVSNGPRNSARISRAAARVERGRSARKPLRHKRLRRTRGATVELFDTIEVESDDLARRPSWAHLALGPLGIPEVELSGQDGGSVGDLATATAGFRDQYYGLVPFVIGDDEVSQDVARPLITSGLIDPVWCRWGQAPARFDSRRIARPSVDIAALASSGPTALARWIDDRLTSKLLVATQTRVIEAIVDEAGSLVPSVPVVALHAPMQQLWRLATVLHAPPVSAWAFARAAGAAMSADAIKLAARQLLDVPLPIDEQRWHDATALLQDASAAADTGDAGLWRHSLGRFAPVATAAYGLAEDDPSVQWWLGRLPNPARGRPEVSRPGQSGLTGGP